VQNVRTNMADEALYIRKDLMK